MNTKKSRRPAQDSAELRRRAEERFREQSAAPRPYARPDAPRLLYELQVHQIELEMQNEELRAARQEVEAGLARYTELFDFAPIGHFVIAGDGTIRDANLAAARLLGVERQRLVGKHLSGFTSGDAADTWARFLGRVLTGDGGEPRSETFDLTLRSRSGDFLEARVTATVLLGMSPTVLVAVEDVTARKHAEAEVREEVRRKDEFLATLSHELRNPLAPIRNSLFLLERAAPGGEQAREAQAVIGRQVTHLTRIVDDLLDVTRIARGKVSLHRERIDLRDLVQRTIDDHRSELEANGVQLAASLGADRLWIDADATRIVQVLGNLLGNAVKFTPRGGTIEVSLRADGESALLVVHDTGAGIAPEFRSQLFAPFQQAPQTLDRARGGLGLGLAMVKGLIELHGGTVGVTSAGVGMGSRFTIQLPLQAAPPASERPARTEQAPSRRVLVIEDNIDAADSLKEALEFEGHEVVVAHDGPTGLALARELRPEVILCDIGLPGMDGYEVARAIQADDLLEGVRLVALTGYALPEDLRRAADAGFEQHVSKPPDLDKLQQILTGVPGRK